MTDLALNLQKVCDRITIAAHRADRNPNGIQLLAVSKTKPAAMIRELYQNGQRDFGENYWQEAAEKIAQLRDLQDIKWHFIGPIQSNKTAGIAAACHWVHSVDRIKIAMRLSEQRPAEMEPLNICVQLNLDNEPSKSGVLPNEHCRRLSKRLTDLPNLRLRGLMAIPKPQPNYESQLQSLRRLQSLLMELKPSLKNLDTLSVGMSNDLEAAIAAGSTMVRIGTDLFGSRNSPATKQ